MTESLVDIEDTTHYETDGVTKVEIRCPACAKGSAHTYISEHCHKELLGNVLRCVFCKTEFTIKDVERYYAYKLKVEYGGATR